MVDIGNRSHLLSLTVEQYFCCRQQNQLLIIFCANNNKSAASTLARIEQEIDKGKKQIIWGGSDEMETAVSSGSSTCFRSFYVFFPLLANGRSAPGFNEPIISYMRLGPCSQLLLPILLHLTFCSDYTAT